MKLLTRDEFRESVFERDGRKCVLCKSPAQDAHHILERRLWPDSGYYLENGASVCGECHILCEQTVVTCDTVRAAAKITKIVLPPHLYRDQPYDKWGNPILDNGTRIAGELFDDESVQKILQPVLHLFTHKVKYPRTYHLPWSPGMNDDDRKMESLTGLANKNVVMTLKMDGENTTMYRDGIHARSIEYSPHPSRDYIRSMHAKIAHDIPEGWRVCGENLFAVHSIKYMDLPSYFMVFSIWNEKNECLSWSETVEWAKLLGFETVPQMYRGDMPSEQMLGEIFKESEATHEGYVIRVAEKFHYKEFRKVVGKYVRENHVRTHGHWSRQQIDTNKLARRCSTCGKMNHRPMDHAGWHPDDDGHG